MGEEPYRRAVVVKRLIIIVEGQTERDFVKNILSSHLNTFGIFLVPILIRTSQNGRGGLVNSKHLINTIRPVLKESNKTDFVVTTFVDFFRIPDNMPGYQDIDRSYRDEDKAKHLEQSLNDEINDRRFFAYIQLHEFEALLFSSNTGFEKFFPDVADKTAEIVESFDNPEDINGSPQTAPSKRIMSIINNYNKPLFGKLIAEEIGLGTIISRCPRFAAWVNEIIERCKE